MVSLGARIYRGQVGGAACNGCHGESGEGTPLGPALTGKKWLWSDGSYAGIAKTVTEGVSQPKQGPWATARRQAGINRLSPAGNFHRHRQASSFSNSI
jgi:mono/diheme cytochrome c family protein